MSMPWNRAYTLRSYARASLWIVPFVSFLVYLVAIRVVSKLDDLADWTWEWQLEVSAAQSALQTIVTLSLSFMVFTFGSLLVAIQISSAQLTPRIIATTLLRDRVVRGIVGLFIFALLFASGTLIRTQTSVPYLMLTVAVTTGLISLVAFLYLIDYAARLLRPVTIVWRIGESGLAVINSVYLSPIEEPHVPRPPSPVPGPVARSVAHRGISGVILAMNLKALVELARRHDGVIELAHQVGDFVGVGETLFLLYGDAGRIADDDLHALVAFGRERTIEQDPTFAFRVIVDIALKALSKAINDPTTAVLAIDQLHRLLRAAGRRHLHDDAVRDANRDVRLLLPTPNWEDFVQLACREIRLHGAENLQVARRLRAMLEQLMAGLPDSRRAALQAEYDGLNLAIDTAYALPPDVELARVPDLQGLGGRSGTRGQARR